MTVNDVKRKLVIKDKSFIVDAIVYFLRREVRKAGFEKLVIGLSGGVDSSLCAFLSKMALGKESVVGISMPYKTSSHDSIRDAAMIAELLGIEFHQVDITSQIDAYFSMFPDADRVRRGNKMARERMSILYDFAHDMNALVVGTGNKSEALIGYFTRWGDGGYDINPIGDLYKTQVWDIARFIGVPEKIVAKKPSADLWVGQTDEEEIGTSYELLDQILFCYVDLRMGKEDVVRIGYDREVVDKVIGMVRRSQYKRKMGLVCKVSYRTFDKDFLYPRDWGL